MLPPRESPGTTLVGRSGPLSHLVRLLDDARVGTSGTIVLSGEAGIGKSALLDAFAALGVAQGFQVLRMHGIESEVNVPFAGLLTLLRPVVDLIDELPSRQHDAIASALALSPGGDGATHLVGAATLSLLSRRAADHPVAVVVDDVHLADSATRAALLFAVRRLQADRVATALALRTEGAAALDAPDLSWLELERLGVAEARTLARTLMDGATGDAVDRVVAAADGNPLAIVEFARSLPGEDRAGRRESRVTTEFSRRIAALTVDARRLLVTVAASDDDALGPALRVASPSTAAAAIAEIEAAGLASSDGSTLRFVHPLARAAAYRSATPEARRSAHAGLATTLKGVHAVERRAWHLAAAAPSPDEAVATGLEQAAELAVRRGAPAAAAVALERAAGLTPDPDRAASRAFAAAVAAYRAGDLDRAMRLLDVVRAGDHSGRLDAQSAQLRGHILCRRGDVVGGYEALTSAAADLGDRDRHLAVILLSSAAESSAYRSPDEIRWAATRVRELARDDDPTEAFCLGLVYGRSLALTGDWAAGRPYLDRAAALVDLGGVELYEGVAGWIGSEWVQANQSGRGRLDRLVIETRARGEVAQLATALRFQAGIR